MNFKDVYGNTISIDPSSHAGFSGTWLTITSHKDPEVKSPPCALTPGQIRLLIAGLSERLEEIESER